MTIRRKRWIMLTITAIWIAFIFMRSAKPAEESSVESAVFLDVLRQIVPSLTDHVVRKLAHFTEYYILGSLLWLDGRLLKWRTVALPVVIGAVVAFVDELLIQTHTPGRSGELRDVLLDTAGVMTAVGFCLLHRWRKEKAAHGRAGKET